ncbi:hypothetical protein F5B17DRAFT_394178 [Nemania serpens]|nr:hypothetical protein F5B17DRAFT_394178 [Nemania serpens]
MSIYPTPNLSFLFLSSFLLHSSWAPGTHLPRYRFADSCCPLYCTSSAKAFPHSKRVHQTESPSLVDATLLHVAARTCHAGFALKLQSSLLLLMVL